MIKEFIEKHTIHLTDEEYKKVIDIAQKDVTKDYISKDKIKEKADDYESKGYIEIAGAMRELLEERN